MTDLFELEAPLDDQGTTEAGPAHMRQSAPLSQLARHWEAARGEFDCANMFAGHPDIESHIAELLALGAIRAVYWLALGSGEVALAREIAEWWADCEPLHGLGETIK